MTRVLVVPWSIEHSSCVAMGRCEGACDATLARRGAAKRHRSGCRAPGLRYSAKHTVIMRQRKVTIQQPGESADKAASKNGPSKQARPPQRSRSPQQLHWLVPLSLVAVRLLSAVVNTVHDCDEAFNYWEPLHFLLHGYGLQTWENR